MSLRVSCSSQCFLRKSWITWWRYIYNSLLNIGFVYRVSKGTVVVWESLTCRHTKLSLPLLRLQTFTIPWIYISLFLGFVSPCTGSSRRYCASTDCLSTGWCLKLWGKLFLSFGIASLWATPWRWIYLGPCSRLNNVVTSHTTRQRGKWGDRGHPWFVRFEVLFW